MGKPATFQTTLVRLNLQDPSRVRSSTGKSLYYSDGRLSFFRRIIYREDDILTKNRKIPGD